MTKDEPVLSVRITYGIKEGLEELAAMKGMKVSALVRSELCKLMTQNFIGYTPDTRPVTGQQTIDDILA